MSAELELQSALFGDVRMSYFGSQSEPNYEQQNTRPPGHEAKVVSSNT